MMDKTFDHAAVEGRIAEIWERAEAFRAGRPERAGAEPFTIMIPPPNVTGSLHMGHALNNTLQDVLCRFERMRGRDVLWQPGMDHAGIATQMVVERKLAAENRTDRRAMGREAFLKEVWAWKEESGGAIVNQLKRLGASCDWSRERFTMDEGLSKAVLKVFVDLYRQGLLYKDKRLVNWDPKFQTAISDLEVQQVEQKGHLWHFRYPIEGEEGRFITVATTRPETMLGDTAVAVHPEDARYADLVGKFAILPLVGRRIPIVADEYSDPEKGSGAVKITPAHDFNDFEVGKRHSLPLVNVFDRSAHVTLEDNEEFLANAAPDPEAMALHGLDRFAARERIVALMEARGLLAEIVANVHAVPHGDRSGVVVEPYLTDQWFVNAKPLAERALAAVEDGRTRFVPDTWEKTYYQWLENIEPWCVSRQLWWGHQIPAWYGLDGRVFVDQTEEGAFEQAVSFYRETAGESGLFQSVEILEDFLANPQGRVEFLRRDEDVLDTWFSSALWPFSTLGWPDETPEVARYYPTSTLVTAFDIIFFWVARMMMMGLHFMDEVPFSTVYIHALVRDQKGAKMSKSKGNVIDPLSLIDDYGADALRFTLAAMAAQGRDIKLTVSRVEGYRNFSTKIWNAARFAEMNGCVRVAGYDPGAAREMLNRWALSECTRAFAEVTAALEAYRFNDAAAAAYRFTWNVFCDWYVELAKPLLQGEDGPAKDETRATAAFLIDQVCKLLHPFMPFITEALWEAKGAEGPAREEPVLALAAWPDRAGLVDEAAEAEIGWVVDLVSEIRSARSETGVPGGAQVPLLLLRPSQAVRARADTWADMIRRLARVSEIAVAESAPQASALLVVRGESAALALEGVVDIAAERARLAKEDGKLASDEAKARAKLDNPAFLQNAKEEVIDEMRERLETVAARREKVGEALARLGG